MYEIYARTDVGRVRLNNEDGYLINDLVVQEGSSHLVLEVAEFLVAVADGMGGANAGELASQLALTECSRLPLPVQEEDIQPFIQEQVHPRILEYGHSNPEVSGLGTTLSGIVCQTHHMTIFHVGDSRVYRFRDGFLKQLTTDHTLVDSLYQMGQLTEEERENHPEQHILLRCLGGGRSSQLVQVDVQTLRRETAVGDLFLLCTDGLNGMLNHQEIESVLAESLSLQNGAERLVQLANERGGTDNITIVLVKRRAD